MRRATLTTVAAFAAIALVMSAARPTPRKATFTPQIPSASRAGGNRVFLEHAEVLTKAEADSFMTVRDNVEFSKGPMRMYCDSAHYYPTVESFEAFGNVRMEQGDTLFVFADELNYDGPSEVAYLYADAGKKVRLINRDVKLETDIFVYDLGIDLGYYTVGGVLTDKQNRLTSLEGEYVPSTKDANFYTDVHLEGHDKDDNLDIYTDSLFYNTATHIAELYSPSEVINARGNIYTTNGVYNTSNDTTALYDRSLIKTPEGRTLTADTIYYNRVTGIGHCYGNMVGIDSARQASIEADYGFFNQEIDSAYATGRLLVKEYSQGDTLYLHGGQINTYRLLSTVEIPGVEADTILGTPAIEATSRTDTTNVADVWPRVRFYRSDMQGICDSMRVTGADTTLHMYISPVIWNENRQVFGNVIELHMNDSTIDRAHLPEFGFCSEKIVDDYYNQLSGKEMLAYFENRELKRLDINGNVELIMYPEEVDSTINKQVDSQSSFLTALFKGNSTEYVKMWPETTGNVTPLFMMRRSKLFLSKFKQFDGMRPLGPADVFVIPKAMDQLMEEARNKKD